MWTLWNKIYLTKIVLKNLWSQVWKGGFQLKQILVLLGMYFDAAVVFVTMFYFYSDWVWPCVLCEWYWKNFKLSIIVMLILASYNFNHSTNSRHNLLLTAKMLTRKTAIITALAHNHGTKWFGIFFMAPHTSMASQTIWSVKTTK